MFGLLNSTPHPVITFAALVSIRRADVWAFERALRGVGRASQGACFNPPGGCLGF